MPDTLVGPDSDQQFVQMSDGTLARFEPHKALPSVSVRWPTFGSYVGKLARRLGLAPKLARYQIQADLSDTKFGPLWLLLSPLLIALPSIFVFGYLLRVDRGVANYPLFAFSGLILFRIFSRTWVRCARSFRPKGRPNVPLGVPAGVGVCAHAMHESVVAIPGVVVCLIWALSTGAGSPEHLPVALAAVLGAFALAVGVGFVVAALSVRLADFAEAIPHLIRPLTYASGVWFMPTAYVAGTRFEPLFEWNPMLALLNLFRGVSLGNVLTLNDVWVVLISIGVSNLFGIAFLWRTETKPW